MKKVLIIYSSRIPSVDIVCNMLQHFHHVKKIDVVEMQIINCRKKHIEWADVIVVIRPFEISAYGIIKAAKNAGREIIVYLDDDLLHLPHIYSSKLRKMFTLLSYKRNCEYLIEILGLCDVLWGSGEVLTDHYGKYVKKGRCVNTDVTVDISRRKSASVRGGNVNILYTGSSNHYAQLNSFIIPAINKLVSKYENIILTCVGFRTEKIEKCNAELKCYPWFDSYDDYYAFILGQSFDIGVAPIEQTDFYRCKYYNKFVEYSLLGTVGIYTNDFPYKSIVIDKENGIMVDNTVEAWASGIEYAINHEQECYNMVIKAQECCEQRFNTANLMGAIEEKLPELFLLQEKEKCTKVRFWPHFVINYARKYANKFVKYYEKVRS